MSYPINQKINPYPQTSTGINTPQLQNINSDAITQNAINNTPLRNVTNSDEGNKLLTPALTLPVGIGMIYGIDKFNKACQGEYKKGLLYRMGEKIDKIVGKSEFAKKSFEKLEGGINTVSGFFKEKVINKLKITSAFFNTPSVPESKSVLMMSKGPIGEIASHASSVIEKLFEQGNEIKLNGQKITSETVKEIVADPHSEENIKKIIKICEEQMNKDSVTGDVIEKVFKVEKWGQIPKTKTYLSDLLSFAKPLTSKIASNEIKLSEYANKMKTIQEVGMENWTWAAKKLPKAFMRVLEGLTNGTAGGKIAVLLGAYFVADAITKAIEAPKGNGEKRKTFAENLIANIGFYATMPLAIGTMHKFGGLQYIGMNENQVKEYRKTILEINEAAKAGNKLEYQALKKALKNMKPKDGFMGIIYKPMRFLARRFMVGLETIKPLNTGKVLNYIPKAWYHFKRGAGYPIRFIAFGMMFAPFFGNMATRLSHLIFGRPTKSILDGEKSTEKTPDPTMPILPEQLAQQASKPVMMPTQQQTNLANNQINQMHQINPVQKENLVNMYKTNPTVGKAMVSTPQEPARRYIPSSEAVKIIPTDKDVQRDAKTQALMNKADIAEELANRSMGK